MEVIPSLFRKDDKRQYEHFNDQGKTRTVRRDRDNAPTAPRGGRGGRRPPRDQAPAAEKKEETPAQ